MKWKWDYYNGQYIILRDPKLYIKEEKHEEEAKQETMAI